MIKLPIWILNQKFPAFYDSESATAIEQTAKVYGAMQQLIEEYNSFATRLNEEIEKFMEATDKEAEVFRTELRQEFQDFIDVIELKIESQDQLIKEAVNYMKDNIIRTTENIVIQALENNEIYATLNYDSENESLTLCLTKESE